MNQVFKIVVVPLLFVIEYAFKFLAGVGAAIVLAAEGSFFAKISAGFGSVIPTLQQLSNAPARLTYLSTVIEDYNTLTASTFNQRYGGQAINNVLEQLNEGVAYLQAIYQNVSEPAFFYDISHAGHLSLPVPCGTDRSICQAKRAGVCR
ncbi:MAG: hypothetical protein U5K69_21840 [Balneolaceae bacterium]|nr:hypothetical protein [Balneolaceae bacterium]